MTYLKLSFYSQPEVELVSAEFYHHCTKATLYSVRGKTAGAYRQENYGSFQWTAAVQALSILFLRQAAWTNCGKSKLTKPILCGAQGTPAASLSFSLARSTLWLQDMFGLEKSGRLLARRFFLICNPELKRPGPVQIALNENFMPGESLHIYLNNEETKNPQIISSIADDIEIKWGAKSSEQNYTSSYLKQASSL